MRLIGTLKSEAEAHRLSIYLKKQGMENSCEPSFDSQTGHVDYQIWMHDEDRLRVAEQIFREYQQYPGHPKYNVFVPPPEPSPTSEPKAPRTFATHFTNLVIGLCSLVFLFDSFQKVPMLKEGLTPENFFLTPIEALFLYDLPAPIGELEKVVEKYTSDPQKLLPPEMKAELQKVAEMPYWHGIYDWIVAKIKKKNTASIEGPLFTSIRQGEVWRLITPVLLHGNLLHILFNMLWVWVLGRPIEMRIGPLRTLILSLAVGVGSNTIQYLMTGPFFLGYSGIVMGLAGFIWMRERLAPWEGYPLNRPTIFFIALFIGAIFILQVGTFFIQIFTNYTFTPNIANSAHIAGGIIGALLGRLQFFARVKT